jgi:hypothetical protein
MNDQIREALQSTAEETGLGIGIDLRSGTGHGGSRELSLLIHLKAETLPLRKEAGRSLDDVTFAAAVLDQTGKVIVAKERAAKIDMTADELTDLIRDGLEVTMSLPVQTAGSYRVRAVVTESEGHKVGAMSQNIDVP